jgi:CBS domain containing-hemolysin-like protein
VNQQLNLSLPEQAGYTTIAGFLMDRAGRVLNIGDEVDHEAGVFRVEKVHGRRILRILFIPIRNHTSPPQGVLGYLLAASSWGLMYGLYR